MKEKSSFKEELDEAKEDNEWKPNTGRSRRSATKAVLKYRGGRITRSFDINDKHWNDLVTCEFVQFFRSFQRFE